MWPDEWGPLGGPLVVPLSSSLFVAKIKQEPQAQR